jgi:hypothetical protein
LSRPDPTRRALLGGALAGGVLALGGLGARAQAPAKRLLVIVANGGWDPTFVFDPKSDPRVGPNVDPDPDDPDDRESVTRFGPFSIATNPVRRPSVTSFFAHHAQRVTVINGLWGGTLSHNDGMLRLLTGGLDESAPDLVAIAGARLGAGYAVPALDVAGVGRPGPYAATTGRIGVRGQLTGLIAPELRYPMPDGSPRPDPALDPEDWDGIAAFRAARLARAPGGAVPGRDEALERADALAAHAAELRLALPAGRRRTLEDDLRVATSLFEEGVCHSALVSSGESWDTHAEAWRQHESFDRVFRALDRLIPELERRGLLDSVQVAVVSEMGRTPLRNLEDGTDHWPYTSALLFGGDTAGGRLLGGTDDDVFGLPCDPSTGRVTSSGEPLRFSSFVAGLLAGVGVDDALPGVEPLRGHLA